MAEESSSERLKRFLTTPETLETLRTRIGQQFEEMEKDNKTSIKEFEANGKKFIDLYGFIEPTSEQVKSVVAASGKENENLSKEDYQDMMIELLKKLVGI